MHVFFFHLWLFLETFKEVMYSQYVLTKKKTKKNQLTQVEYEKNKTEIHFEIKLTTLLFSDWIIVIP